MNIFVRSLALGLVSAAFASGAIASANRDTASEMGCPASAYRAMPASTVVASSDGAGLERISTRVERLGQGIAATPLVHGLMTTDGDGRSDQRGEPTLTTMLLAAAAVVMFVARRRRIN